MPIPLHIVYRDIEPTQAIDAYIRGHFDKLSAHTRRAVSCHVALEAPHRSKHHGRHYRVRIELSLPGRGSWWIAVRIRTVITRTRTRPSTTRSTTPCGAWTSVRDAPATCSGEGAAAPTGGFTTLGIPGALRLRSEVVGRAELGRMRTRSPRWHRPRAGSLRACRFLRWCECRRSRPGSSEPWRRAA